MKKLVKKQNGGATSQIKSGVKQVAKGVKKGVDDTVKSAKSTAKTVVKATPQYKAYKAAGSAMKSVDDSLQKRYPNYTGKGSFYDGAKSAVKSVMGYKNGGAKKYQDGGVTRQDIKQAKMKAKLDRINAGTEPSTYEKVSTISGNVAKTAGAAAEAAKAIKDARTGTSGPGMKKGGAIKYKTGGMVNPNASVQASKVAKGRPAKSAEPKSAAKKATGRTGGISKAPKAASPKMKMGGMKGKSC
jgi:hypothetical protein